MLKLKRDSKNEKIFRKKRRKKENEQKTKLTDIKVIKKIKERLKINFKRGLVGCV